MRVISDIRDKGRTRLLLSPTGFRETWSNWRCNRVPLIRLIVWPRVLTFRWYRLGCHYLRWLNLSPPRREVHHFLSKQNGSLRKDTVCVSHRDCPFTRTVGKHSLGKTRVKIFLSYTTNSNEKITELCLFISLLLFFFRFVYFYRALGGWVTKDNWKFWLVLFSLCYIHPDLLSFSSHSLFQFHL